MVVMSAAESVYSGLGEGEVLQKWAANRRNFGCAGSESCTLGGDLDEIVSH